MHKRKPHTDVSLPPSPPLCLKIKSLNNNKKDYEQLNAKKFDNLSETDKFLQKYYIPKWTEMKTENLNIPESIRGAELITYGLLQRKLQLWIVLLVSSCRHSWKKYHSSHMNSFRKHRTLPRFRSGAGITPTPKSDKEITNKDITGHHPS